jgi:hypothetical protein
VATEAVLAEMRNSDPPVQYLVGTPKGRLNRLEKYLLEKPYAAVIESSRRWGKLGPRPNATGRAVNGLLETQLIHP